MLAAVSANWAVTCHRPPPGLKPGQQRWARAGPPRAGSTEPPEASFLSGFQVRPSPLETPGLGAAPPCCCWLAPPGAGLGRCHCPQEAAELAPSWGSTPDTAGWFLERVGQGPPWGRGGWWRSSWPDCPTGPGVCVPADSPWHWPLWVHFPREVQSAHRADLGGDSVNWRNAWERAGSPLSPHTTRPHVFLTLPPCTPVLAALRVSSLANRPRSPGHIPCR